MDSIAVQKHELPPTNQKRMVAFINHFIVSTVTFLNKFASDCETRFINYEHKIQNLEASLMIVEAKLASIDVLRQTSVPNSAPVKTDQNQSEDNETIAQVKNEVPNAEVEHKDTEGNERISGTHPDTPTVEKDPKYDLYFKMLHMGVPLGAVKNKISSEGLDPNYIDQFL
ncbi:WASH complex subunit 3 [Anopheles nili]|uniref:WASH complex subunit 3 n=1 Tax=Anopheles nili TaxID=185578 RepID=UPI00237AD7FA|nr:WASH complex subunit 3 [Anopheles nili]